MKQEKRASEHLSMNLWIPLMFAVVICLIGFWASSINKTLGYVLYAVGIVDVIISVIQYQQMDKTICEQILSADSEKNQVKRHLLEEMPFPYAITDKKGEFLMYNSLFGKIMGPKNKRDISQVFTEIHKKVFPQEGQTREYDVVKDGKYYRISCKRFVLKDVTAREEDEEKKTKKDGNQAFVYAFYVKDETELHGYKVESQNKRLVVGLIYIDNYEEVLEPMEEVQQALLAALVERTVIKYIQKYEAIVKKFEKDKFLFVLEEKNLPVLIEDKFSILDEVREINTGNSLAMTLSISVGVNAPSFPETYESARIAMDLALGRGGDQAVVRDGDSVSYFGGKSQQVEKMTRVKARVKAHALREMMLSQGQIFIMGHKNPDADCVGAALGVYRIARIFGKKAFIVMPEDCPNIAPVVERLHEGLVVTEEGEEKVFLSNEEALERCDDSTMLVVVDVNIPHMTECPELLEKVDSRVVLDHHRQTDDTISHAVLSYVEPYASSTCEMVTEILQYVADKPKLQTIEADALYSGILVDTDSFVVKAGVRTFEAAAFLRRAGADVTRVRKMFREDINEVKMRTDIIHRAELYMDEFIISTFDGRDVPGATVIGAKAANELLDIQNVRGTFVVTRQPNYIYISARSIDNLNVQVIMEKIGGGGHLTVAATQLTDTTVEEAVDQLKKLLAKMKEDGDI